MNTINVRSSIKSPIDEDNLSHVIIIKSLPNKRCVLNNYMNIPLEARNISNNNIQVKLKKYRDWFSVPIDCVLLLQ